MFAVVVTVFFFATAVAVPVRADSLILGDGYKYTNTTGTYVVALITGSTINGQGIGGIICDDAGDDTNLGSIVQVNIEPLTGVWETPPMFASGGEKLYEELAILESWMALSVNQNEPEQALLQMAVWDLTIPGSGAAIAGLPAGADSALIRQVAEQVGDYFYSGEIFTPTGSSEGNQEFLLLTATPLPPSGPTPEPSTLSLLGSGLLLSALLMKRAMLSRRKRTA
jgi:hypothetical protein